MAPKSTVCCLATALLLVAGHPLAAAGCVQIKEGHRLGGAIALEHDPGLPAAVVAEAIAYWSACESYRTGFPAFLDGGEGERVLEVRLVEGNSGSPKCGSFSGARIVVYTFASSDSGRLARCGAPARLLAHELGHALGLSDCPDKRECRGAMMSRSHPRMRSGPMVTEGECEAVDSRWVTPTESGLPLVSRPSERTEAPD